MTLITNLIKRKSKHDCNIFLTLLSQQTGVRALLEIPEKLRLGITTDNFLDCLKIIYLTENRKSPTKSYCLLSKELMLAFHRALFLGLYSFNKFT